MPNIIFDDFESGLRIINPLWSGGDKYLWNHYEGEDGAGDEGIDTSNPHGGTNCLYGRKVTSNSIYMYFYPYEEDHWDYLREWVLVPGNWIADTYTRMKFWMKVPVGITRAAGGDYNFNVGTYNRRWGQTDKTVNEDLPTATYNSHFYHWYNIPYTGEWHQFIVDTYPDHQREHDPSADQGDKIYYEYDTFGESEAGHNYWDCMTACYIDFHDNPSSYPAYWYFDDFELYQEPNSANENLLEVRSLHGVYVPSSNTIIFGFRKQKSTTSDYIVKYAWSSIHSLGWANAYDAPSGTISPLGSGGYNEMYYSTTSIDITGHPYIYMGVKKSGSSYFREMEIPTGQITSRRNPSHFINLQQHFRKIHPKY